MSGRRKRTMVWVILAVALAAVVGILLTVGERNQRQIAQTLIEAVDLTQVPNGTFTGRCNAFPVIAQVQVAVKDHEITNILLEQHLNGQGGGAEVIPDRVVKAQSLLVDTVSGATYSSKVILLAIRDALQNAIGQQQAVFG